MKEKKELQTGVRVALQIVCVVMASLTLLQAAAFLVMADFGFYHSPGGAGGNGAGAAFCPH